MSSGGNGHATNRADSDLLGLLTAGEPPAFATGEDHRITFWNRGAERVFGRPARDVIGTPCHDVVEGRDIFGNRFCYSNCALMATARGGESIGPCEIEATAPGQGKRPIALTTLRLPTRDGESFSLVHVVQPLVGSERVVRGAQQRTGNGHGGGVTGFAAIASGPGQPSTTPDSEPPLTPREREILHWVALGRQNKEVANELGISLATVRNHVHNILDKLEVHSKLEAVSMAFRNGWVGNHHDPSPSGGDAIPN